MILLAPAAAGLLTRLGQAWYRGHPYSFPHLQKAWLAPIAFLPQWLAFYLPVTRERIPDHLAAKLLILSFALLLIFAWINRTQSGFRLMGMGLILNLLVIAMNGGLMPISPEVLEALVPEECQAALEVGERLGSGKDVLLATSETWGWGLSDRFLLPDWLPTRAAFSLGDVLIACGAFWLLWAQGNTQGSRLYKGKNHVDQ